MSKVLAALLTTVCVSQAFALKPGTYDCVGNTTKKVSLTVIDDKHVQWTDERDSSSSAGELDSEGPHDEYGLSGSMIFALTDFYSDSKVFSALAIFFGPPSTPGTLRIGIGQASVQSGSLNPGYEALTCVKK